MAKPRKELAKDEIGEPVEVEVKRPLDKIVPVRLSAGDWAELYKYAHKLGIGPTTLARMWILERLAFVKAATSDPFISSVIPAPGTWTPPLPRCLTLRQFAAALMNSIPDEERRALEAEVEHLMMHSGMAKSEELNREFTRVRRDQTFDRVNVSHLVMSALQMAAPRFREKRGKDDVEIEVNIDLGTVNSVQGDMAELREALLNIILNALDSMPQGGKLTIKAWQEDNQVVLSVADTGAGMPDEVKSKVFDPFFSTKRPDGMGLGLSITYGIITKHGGNIDVESSLGQGSTFYVRLPLGDEKMKNKSSSGSPYFHDEGENTVG